MTRKHYPTKMARFGFIPQSNYGINSGKVNVFSHGRIIGYADDKEMTNFKPINDWPYRFSKSLIRKLGLQPQHKEGLGMTRKDRLEGAGLTVTKHDEDRYFMVWRDNPDDDVWAIYFDGDDVFEYRLERGGATWRALWDSLEWTNMASDRKVTEAEYWSA